MGTEHSAHIRVRPVGCNDAGIPVGEYHHRATIDDATVDAMRELREVQGWKILRIAAYFHVPRTTVRDICNYVRRAQVPTQWKRA